MASSRPSAHANPRLYPALEIDDPGQEDGPLSFHDTVAIVVDDFAPCALEERGGGRLRVYFATEADRDAAQAAIRARRGALGQARALEVSDENWAARSQADLQAIRIGRVVVAPPWHRPADPGCTDDVVVEIHPALGFGSGHHPTTRLALLGLQYLDLHGHRVLDLGTGSGVLAVAAVKLGASAATGVDRDADALGSAQNSVAANHVASQVELRDADISDLGPRDVVSVVVANLTGAALTTLAPVITSLVVQGGRLVLSGILLAEEARVSHAYAEQACLVWRDVEDEWVGMVWERKYSG